MDRILLVTRNQSKHPDRGCAKASHDGRISGRGEFNRASPKKMCEKFWTLSSKHPDRGCAKASHDGQISGRGELDRASPQKNVQKILDVIWGKTVSSSRVNGTAHPEGRSFYCGIFRLYTVPLPDSLFSNHSFISFSSVNCKPLIVTISLFGSPLP